MQNGHLLSFYSLSLIQNETKYAKLERELLAIKFACKGSINSFVVISCESL